MGGTAVTHLLCQSSRVGCKRPTVGCIYVLLQIPQGLVELEVARGTVESTVHRLIKLLLLHAGHLFDVLQLQEEQGQK